MKSGICIILIFSTTNPFAQNGSDMAVSDSASVLSRIRSNITYFQTGLGYEYGLLPFMADMRIPQGNYLIDGTFGLRLKGLPFTGGYYYSGSESVSGLNNHFNIHFDIYAYKQQQKEKFDKLKDEKIKALKRAIVEKE